MQPILSVSAMRSCDEKTILAGTDSKILMYRAGESIFRSRSWEGQTAIVTGSGNNAGDGYVLALLLQAAGKSCRLVRLTEKCSPDGAYYLEKCVSAGIPCTTETDFSETDTIVDCILGTGFRGEVRPDLRAAIEKINCSPAYVISVDINSGLNGNTGEGTCCVCSDMTLSIGFVKYGHLVGIARGLIGRLRNYDIGIACTEGCTPFYAAGEVPEKLTHHPAKKKLFLHYDELRSIHLPGETPGDWAMALARNQNALLVVYGACFILLSDGEQCCILETPLSAEVLTQCLETCTSMADMAKAVSSCTDPKSVRIFFR
ncbi:MAG: NAD(P)H-hydrate epimerase [Ruminococcus sp.]|nr:NAD(P)H-hydrate epimerase [Ruminococcus sp.]